MSYLHAVVTEVPAYSVSASEAEARLRPFFEAAGEDPQLIEQIFQNSAIERRGLAMPQAFYLEERGLTARNHAYGEVARELGVRAARRALDEAGVAPDAVDLIVDTSCTGIMIPALDAALVNALGMRKDVRRMPLTEIGCAAGAVAVSRAHDHLRAYPEATVLVVSVELPSLTLQLGDGSRANLVSAALFGDGAAAAVLSKARPARASMEVLATRSILFPDTLDLMGFDLRSEGFHIVLSQRIPALVKRELRPELEAFLAAEGHRLEDLGFHVLHPGGARVLDNMQEVLGLDPAQVDPSRDVLRRHGNLSSASVLFVAREVLDRGGVKDGALGVLCAMGPGFALEMVLLRGHVPA
jgi:alkylresorcinol/alkylpyrone synthase